jgi:hypothetical protein
MLKWYRCLLGYAIRAKVSSVSLPWDTAYAALWLASAPEAGRNSADETICDDTKEFDRQPYAAGKHHDAVWAFRCGSRRGTAVSQFLR